VLYREVLYWRELLARAADLESKAGTEADAIQAHWCRARAMRIRRRLHEGMPDDYDMSPNRPPPKFERPASGRTPVDTGVQLSLARNP
jgi:hypothetical protein